MVSRTSTAPPPSAVLLGAVEEVHAGLVALEIDLFRLATEWAAAHPGDEVDESIPFGMRPLEVAGDGAPTVDEECIAEFALATGRSTDAGRALIGDAVECRWRLPKLWDQVMAGRVPVWKARKVTQQTCCLPPEGAGFVDTHLTPVLARCSWAQVERVVEEATVRFDPAQAETHRLEALESRHFDVHLRSVTYDGVVHVDGDLDLADATLLDEAVTAGAAQLADLGSTDPLGVRRSQALGLLARQAVTGQEVLVYVHVQPDDEVAHVEVPGTATGTGTVGVAIAVDQIKGWCQTAGTQVTVRPVIDLNEDRHTDTYEPTPVQQEQVVLTNPVCVFPGCGRPARRADLDHVVEWPHGPTDTSNLAPTCRGHHRLKTHTDWRVERTGPVSFTWTSPHGRSYESDQPLVRLRQSLRQSFADRVHRRRAS